MDRPPPLPLPLEQLPKSLHRFAKPDAPTPAKMMAAKGMVPVKGGDLITLLVQLGNDPDEKVAEAATEGLKKLPDAVLLPALDAELHPSVLSEISFTFRGNEAVVEKLVVNPGLMDHTLVRISGWASESVTELIAVNQQRLLGCPEIVESLYKNRNARMSTIDRLVELCARNDVELKGIPAFKEHVEAIQGQLIPEASDEPLPSDVMFAEALLEEDDAEDAVEIDKWEGTEEIKERFKPLQFRIREMTISEKIRMTLIGDAAARSILIRDPVRMVSQAAIRSPKMTDTEAAAIAHSKEVGEEILRYIGNRKEWLRSYEIKKALAFNPKTPVGVSLRFLSHLRANDLKALSRSRGVPNPLKTAAKQRLEKKGIR